MRSTVTAACAHRLSPAGPAALGSGSMPSRFTARAVVVGDRAGTVVPAAVLEVDEGRISWVGPAAEAPPSDAEVVALPGVLLPGLVNVHSHAPMVLFRGQGEGL